MTKPIPEALAEIIEEQAVASGVEVIADALAEYVKACDGWTEDDRERIVSLLERVRACMIVADRKMTRGAQ
jgi:hypothetical protein